MALRAPRFRSTLSISSHCKPNQLPRPVRNPGAIANVVIKSGTNRLHGSAYYYNRNEALAADPVFVPQTKQRFQSYGFSLGGPIRHDRTFFFTSFERQQFVLGAPTTGTEPSVAYQGEAKNLLTA